MARKRSPGGGGERGDGGRKGRGARRAGAGNSAAREGGGAEVVAGEPGCGYGAAADQDADLTGPGSQPQRQVEGHRLKSEPRGDLGGGGPFGIGGLGREDQSRAEAVGHAVAVFVQDEVAGIEQRGEVEGGWGGGGLCGDGSRWERDGREDCQREKLRGQTAAKGDGWP